jgi:hypothetical protein
MTQAHDFYAEIASTGPLTRVADARARYDLALRALTGLAFGSLWGLAAGAAAPLHALANVYKVPMVVVLAVLVALPAVLVARHLLRIEISKLLLVTTLVSAMYRSLLLLLGCAPLLAVYAYTSQWVAPLMAQGSAVAGLLVGGFSLAYDLRRVEGARGQVALLGLITAAFVGLSLLQLISLATPILTMPTAFGAGIDGVLR